MTCSSLKRKLKGRTETIKRCGTKLIASPGTFTAATRRAQLSRAGRVVATGSVRDGRLILHGGRSVRSGRYTLTLMSGAGRHVRRTRWRLLIT